jgi:Peptidase family S64
MANPDRVARVSAAQELHAERLLKFPNVVGTGTGYRQLRGRFGNEVCVQVFVQGKFDPSELPEWAVVPREVHLRDERVRVDVIDVGFVFAAQDTTRYRPVPGGCSIGHQDRIDASTLGGWACDLRDSTIVILTCNHCISNLSVASAPAGILQPGRLDGGVIPGDLIGALKRFVPMTTGTPPVAVTAVDAAIGTITANRTDDVLQIGPAIYELGTPALGMAVQKRGRTTRFTTNGTITSVNVQVTVNYGTTSGLIGNAFIVTSTDGNAFANRGDSGSLIFDQRQGLLNNTRPVVGMFFAVSNGGVTTWHNDINVVFQQLNLTTICDCAIRALIAAIGGASRGSAGSDTAADSELRKKERQLRRFRDQIMAETPFGKKVVDFVESEAADLLGAIVEDEEAFGLAVRTFDPWIQQRTNADILDAELDPETVANLGRLTDRIGKVAPRLRGQLRAMKASVAAVEGMRVRELLEAGKLQPARPRKRR